MRRTLQIMIKFYKKLLKLDPKVKSKFDPNDTQRSIRAYEVKQFTNKSLHDWFQNTKSYFKKDDFFKIECDIIIPAALELVICGDVAKDLNCKVIVEAANGPLDLEADKILRERNNMGSWR